MRPGQHVLIIGASGGVGTFAVQIARAYGAEVTGACRTSKTDLVAAVGANHVLDYTREDPADGRHRYNVVIDIGGNRRLAHLRRALTPTGTLVIAGGEDGGSWFGAAMGRNISAHLLNPFTRQRLTGFVALESRANLLVLREMAESGAITPRPSNAPTRSARPPKRSVTSPTDTSGAKSSSPSEARPAGGRYNHEQ